MSDISVVKGFDENYSADEKKRIAGIEPKDIYKDGPAIRHSINFTSIGRGADRGLFIILSDGKPGRLGRL